MPSSAATSLPRAVRSAATQLLTRQDGRTALFSSFGGRFSDNPRAVYEELVRRGSPLDPVWVSETRPDGVAPRSPAYARALGRARVLVTNERLPSLVKKPGVTYVQTWHGTMLKRIGFDNPRYASDPSGLAQAAKDYGRWDLLLSQNPFSTKTMRSAFRYDGEVLESGYPRNDLLLSPEADAVRARVRAEYGVPDGVLLVLYAPTFRDDQTAVTAPLPLELSLLGAALGDGVHVLVRLHHRVLASLAEPPSSLWSSASEHEDIRELYLAADALVTDYSSVMFDFAVTGKPMVFFTYDLEHYRSSLRGFYFDLSAQAPGPLCRTTAEVVDALGDLAGVARQHAGTYAEFQRTYVPWDDGAAAARVVDRLLRDL